MMPERSLAFVADMQSQGVIPADISHFHNRCLTLLDGIVGGIDLAPIVWRRCEWRCDVVEILWRGAMGSHVMPGGASLTEAVFLAHDAAIQMIVFPRTHQHLRLKLTDKASRLAFSRHPTLSGAVNGHNRRYPASHPIHFTGV